MQMRCRIWWRPCQEIRELELGVGDVGDKDWCSLIDYDEGGEKKALAAALYRFGEMSYADALTYIEALGRREESVSG